MLFFFVCLFFFQAEDGIRDLVRSRGLGDVYKRQATTLPTYPSTLPATVPVTFPSTSVTTGTVIFVSVVGAVATLTLAKSSPCLLYTSDAADERSSVDLGGRRIIKKKTKSH